MYSGEKSKVSPHGMTLETIQLSPEKTQLLERSKQNGQVGEGQQKPLRA